MTTDNAPPAEAPMERQHKNIFSLKAIKKALLNFLRNAWTSLSSEHSILSIFFQENVEFPRSDRVLVFLAYILSQLWVTGLFRNSGVIQPVWVCTSTSSGELQWGAMNATDCCDYNCALQCKSAQTFVIVRNELQR